jgi:non-ribosomal peptide synthetase component F/acyl carrier protein
MADSASGVAVRVRAAWTDVLADAGTVGSGFDEAVSFVTAGGHSLAAARIVARLRAELGVAVPLSALLRDDPNLAEFAAVVAEHAAAGVTAGPAPVAARAAEVAGTAAEPAALPLAPTMRRIWTWHRLYPESSAYNVSRVLRIEGRIRPAALRAATVDLAARHEALRCAVHEPRPGDPRITVGPPAPVPVSVQVVAGTAEDPMAGVDEALHLVGARPFPLDAAPLWRIGVVYASTLRCTFLVLVTHHLISDLRSADRVLHELAVAYEAHLAGRSQVHDAPAPSLLDHVEHELGLAGTPAWERDLDWWARRLGEVGTATAAPLPFAVADRDERVYAAETTTADLNADASELVNRALRDRGVTPAIFFLTAAAAVVRAWTGGGPEIVGVPSVRFHQPEDHQLIGFLLDTLPLRIAADPGETFDEACRRTRDAYTDAAEHALPAFDDIVDRLCLPRATGARSPLIRLWFSDMTHADVPTRFGDLAAVEYDLPPAWSLFELGIYLRRLDRGRFRLHMVVPRGVYRQADTAQLLAQIVRMAQRAAAHPARSVGELLGPEPTHHPAPGPAAARLAPAGGGVAEWVARHAAGTPTATAVTDATGDLDYLTLGDLVEREAATLRDVAGPGAVVAVPGRRDRTFVVRLVACRRAGVTAVLIDAVWPQRRRVRAAELAGVTHAYPDVGAGPVAATGRRVPGVDPGPGHVLFTSGTTGDPLPVRVAAAVAEAALTDLGTLLGVTAADRVSLLSGAAHDPVLRDVGLALHAGAAVCLPPAAAVGDPRGLASWLRRERVSVVNATPALLGLVLGAEQEPFPGLRAVVCGGSALSARTAALIRRRAPGAVIVNGYGCTETPQLVAANVLAPDDELPTTAQAPIGRPLPGRRIELRAAGGLPCDTGQVGELWVAGPHLAEGYVGEGAPPRFRTDAAGTRWLATGDLARRDAGGLLHLAGRTDRQVLLGGYRVTLDEIEDAARGCPGVADAVAQAVGDGDDRGARVWAQRAPGQLLAAETVRAHLEAVLPIGAVPARVLVVDRLELGVNLKPAAPAVDPEPGPAAADVDADLRRLADSMLGRRLDPTTNFFDAGFTSVSLVQLSAELGELLGRPVEALTVFQHPNLSALAAFLHGPRPPQAQPAEPGDGRVEARDRRREIRARIRESMAQNPAKPA